MILHVEFRADRERWRVRVAEAGFTRDEANRMAYDTRGAGWLTSSICSTAST